MNTYSINGIYMCTVKICSLSAFTALHNCLNSQIQLQEVQQRISVKIVTCIFASSRNAKSL